MVISDLETTPLDQFDICEDTKTKLQKKGINSLFPIQSQTYQFLREGKNVLAQARTGTGKTYGFGLPVIESLKKLADFPKRRKPKVVVLTPTRELAIQIVNDLNDVGNPKMKISVFVGGTSVGIDIHNLSQGVDIVVATPGRLSDLILRKVISFDDVETLILDECDRMLDMGFKDDVETILFAITQSAKTYPQMVLFSATLPNWVEQLFKGYVAESDRLSEQVSTIQESDNKTSVLVEHIAICCNSFPTESPRLISNIIDVYASSSDSRCIVFCHKKIEASNLGNTSEMIKRNAQILHGDIPQNRRSEIFEGFRQGRFSLLVTTDVAARGLDLSNIDLVIQCNLPSDFNDYIHRSGRTGRAGRQGRCVLLYSRSIRGKLFDLEYRARIKFDRRSPPTNEEVIESTSKNVVEKVKGVAEESSKVFLSQAKNIIQEIGPEAAVASCLALVAGYQHSERENELENGHEEGENWSKPNNFRKNGRFQNQRFNHGSANGHARFNEKRNFKSNGHSFDRKRHFEPKGNYFGKAPAKKVFKFDC